jgi:hypothetical protein
LPGPTRAEWNVAARSAGAGGRGRQSPAFRRHTARSTTTRRCGYLNSACAAGLPNDGYQLLERVRGSATSKHKFRFKNQLVSLDSTVIDLCISVFDWAKFRRTKGAVKLHLVLDHDGYLPCFG